MSQKKNEGILFSAEIRVVGSYTDRLLNADKRQQIAKNINFYMFALLEIARIYKALKRFADLQGPICYKDAQNTETNLIVYQI